MNLDAVRGYLSLSWLSDLSQFGHVSPLGQLRAELVHEKLSEDQSKGSLLSPKVKDRHCQ
jgi:hypothetical protein